MSGRKRWIGILEEETDLINKTPHTRYKFIPNKVNKRNQKEIFEQFYNKARRIEKKIKFKVLELCRHYAFLFHHSTLMMHNPSV